MYNKLKITIKGVTWLINMEVSPQGIDIHLLLLKHVLALLKYTGVRSLHRKIRSWLMEGPGEEKAKIKAVQGAYSLSPPGDPELFVPGQ